MHLFIKKREERGQEAHHFRIKKARFLGYDYMLCTVVSTNTIQIHILDKNGWKELDRFISRKTENTVILFGKKLI
jgi:hypothetical protein